MSSPSLVNLEHPERRERRGIEEAQERWVKEGYLVSKALRDHLDQRVQKVKPDLQERQDVLETLVHLA